MDEKIYMDEAVLEIAITVGFKLWEMEHTARPSRKLLQDLHEGLGCLLIAMGKLVVSNPEDQHSQQMAIAFFTFVREDVRAQYEATFKHLAN